MPPMAITTWVPTSRVSSSEGGTRTLAPTVTVRPNASSGQYRNVIPERPLRDCSNPSPTRPSRGLPSPAGERKMSTVATRRLAVKRRTSISLNMDSEMTVTGVGGPLCWMVLIRPAGLVFEPMGRSDPLPLL